MRYSASPASEREDITVEEIAPSLTLDPHSSLPEHEKYALRELDQGRCLITSKNAVNDWVENIAHILPCEISYSQMSYFEERWGLTEAGRSLNLDSTENLVTLLGFWRLIYSKGDWAFAPTIDILQKILRYGKRSNWFKPYPGYDPTQLLDYTFVPFHGSLSIPIVRQMNQQQVIHVDSNGGEGEGEGEDEDEDKADGSPEPEHVVTRQGEAIVHKWPFSHFPLLKHHAHPFLTIQDTHSKLEQNFCGFKLPKHQRDLFQLVEKIVDSWESRRPPCQEPELGKHPRQDDPPRYETRGVMKRLKLERAGVKKSLEL